MPTAPATLGNAAALEAEVARRKARDGGKGSTAFQSKRDFVHIGDVIQPALDEMLRRHNIPVKSAEEVERDLEQSRQETLDEMESQRQRARWNMVCPEDSIFREPFERSKVPKSVSVASLNKVLNWQYGPRGLHVIGESGFAKTRAVFTMLHRHVDAGRKVMMKDGIGFSTECSKEFYEPSRTEAWLRTMISPDILFIDDLAKRFTKATQEGFFAIIDRRGARKRPTIITTNCTGDQLAGVIGDATLSDPLRRRIKEFCEVVVFES